MDAELKAYLEGMEERLGARMNDGLDARLRTVIEQERAALVQQRDMLASAKRIIASLQEVARNLEALMRNSGPDSTEPPAGRRPS